MAYYAMNMRASLATKLTILHIEDNPEDISMVKESLKLRDHPIDIVNCKSLNSAINKLEKSDFDIAASLMF